MDYQFLNIFLDTQTLFESPKNGSTNINPYLFENNTENIEKFYKFYKDNSSLLLFSGPTGTGKAEIVKYTLKFLSNETILLRFNCFNSTVLDDILLAFYTEFKHLTSQNVIVEPKNRAENFAQKVNSFFTQIDKPILVILDSFEEILDENRKEIVDFVSHLISMKKVKIIVIGRGTKEKVFENMPHSKITTEPLSREIFDKMMKNEKIKLQKPILDDYYKHTNGYYFFIVLSLKIMKKQNFTIVDFLTMMQVNYMAFNTLLENQALTLVSPDERNLFWFLCLIRHPISIEFINQLKIGDDEKIKNLEENLLLLRDGQNVYVQDYLKTELDENILQNLTQKIHQYIIDIYNSQLPLKPLDRNICISRQTMRKEIEYHSHFLPKKPKINQNPSVDVSLLSYSKFMTEKAKEENSQPIEASKVDKKKFDFTQKSKETQPIKNELEKFNTLSDLVVEIKSESKNYQYARVIELCLQALSMNKEKDFDLYLPVIYKKLAFAYQKNAQNEKALKYYKKAEEYYLSRNNIIKVNFVQFNIANILYETYKFDDAKKLFKQIIDSKDSPALLKVKSYLKLANIEEDSSIPENAFLYYKNALEFSTEIFDKETLSELYFKYALATDDKNDVISAMKYYQKCIQTSTDTKINKFLSAAFSNVATLYLESNDLQNCIINFKKSYEIDVKMNNIEGIYYSSSKLAEILHKSKNEEALKYFEIALDSAKLIKDIFYIVSATLAIGDFYFDNKDNEISLKYYLTAKEIATNNLSSDNVKKIDFRINDLKQRMGTVDFERTLEYLHSQEDF